MMNDRILLHINLCNWIETNTKQWLMKKPGQPRLKSKKRSLPWKQRSLKVIVRESHIDTCAAVRHIRAKLSALKEHLPTINYNIIDFNVYVHQLAQSLNARGEKIEDLLPNLFEVYKVAKDKDFVAYIKFNQNDYDEGRDIAPYQLIQLAQNKYKTIVDEKTRAAISKKKGKNDCLGSKIHQTL
jgi:hypothetical protein